MAMEFELLFRLNTVNIPDPNVGLLFQTKSDSNGTRSDGTSRVKFADRDMR
jgi:hypothetical protein